MLVMTVEIYYYDLIWVWVGYNILFCIFKFRLILTYCKAAGSSERKVLTALWLPSPSAQQSYNILDWAFLVCGARKTNVL